MFVDDSDRQRERERERGKSPGRAGAHRTAFQVEVRRFRERSFDFLGFFFVVIAVTFSVKPLLTSAEREKKAENSRIIPRFITGPPVSSSSKERAGVEKNETNQKNNGGFMAIGRPMNTSAFC